MKHHDSKSQSVAISGVIVGVSVVLLGATNWFPFVSLSLTASAGVLLLLLLERTNFRTGLSGFVATTLLALILLPNKEVVLLYGVGFGAYSLLKAKVEQISSPMVVLLCKFGCCNLALLLLYVTTTVWFPAAFLADLLRSFPYGAFALWVALNVAFFLYDRGMTLFMRFLDQQGVVRF